MMDLTRSKASNQGMVTISVFFILSKLCTSVSVDVCYCSFYYGTAINVVRLLVPKAVLHALFVYVCVCVRVCVCLCM